jgi:hypothetical protein
VGDGGAAPIDGGYDAGHAWDGGESIDAGLRLDGGGALDARGLEDASSADASLHPDGGAATAPEVYDFESLSAPTSLGGQDGWTDHPGQGQALVRMDDGLNGSKVASHLETTAINQHAYVTRLNDETFSFMPFSAMDSEAVIQFECEGAGQVLFALGTDLNGDGMLNATDNELGPAFGVADQSFRIQEANGGTVHQVAFESGDARMDWYEVQLRMDFTASGGTGRGSLWIRNLSDGDTRFRLVMGLGDVPLSLGTMATGAGPSAWNALWLNLVTVPGNPPHADNLIPHLAPR